MLSTYDHRVWRTGLPVRSAVLKPHAGKLVVRWVTTSESLLFSVSLHNTMILSGLDVVNRQLVRKLRGVTQQQPCGIDLTLHQISTWTSAAIIDFDNMKR
ncbi:dUTPase [Penicillium antarcticum]|nr:dUTPase [Penicillium antarcticum]